MKTNSDRQSAKIYQFPAGGRAALSRRRESQAAAPSSPTRMKIASGDAWYHDAAIQDGDQSRKR